MRPQCGRGGQGFAALRKTAGTKTVQGANALTRVPSKKRRHALPEFLSQNGFCKMHGKADGPKRRLPFRNFLLAQAQLGDQRTITLDILFLQVSQQIAAAADHLQQPAIAVLIVLVGLQVLVQMIDARGEQRDLNLGGTGVVLAQAAGRNNLLFALHGNNSSFFNKICHGRRAGIPDRGIRRAPGPGKRRHVADSLYSIAYSARKNKIYFSGRPS